MMPQPEARLAGIRIVHAATSANMLTAFGRVMAGRVVEEGAELYLLASSIPIYGRPADVEELRGLGGTPITVPLENSLQPWNLLSNTFRLWRLFQRLRPTIVHTRASIMGICGRLAAWLARVPCVVHHQDDLHAREATLPPWKRRLGGHIECWFANHSDQTFVVSQAVAVAAIELGFDDDRVTNVGHDLAYAIREGARSPETRRIRHPILVERGIGQEHFVVGAITRLEPHKGVDMLIEAAALVVRTAPHTRFVVRGRGPERSRLNAMIQQRDLAKHFHLIDDWLTDQGLVDLYRSFDVFALPTRREGFGMAFAEAMLLGVVPIAPDIPPVNEVVTPNTGLLVPSQAAAFAEAILWAIQNPAALRVLRAAARTEAESRWSGTRAADRVIAVYERLLRAK